MTSELDVKKEHFYDIGEDCHGMDTFSDMRKYVQECWILTYCERETGITRVAFIKQTCRDVDLLGAKKNIMK